MKRLSTEPKVRTNFTIDPKVHKLLVEYSNILGVSQSGIVQRAVQEYILKQQKVVELLKGENEDE